MRSDALILSISGWNQNVLFLRVRRPASWRTTLRGK